MRPWSLLILAVAALVVGCDDRFGPVDWDATQDTAILFSAARPELLGLPSAFDFVTESPVQVEQPGATDTWDVVLTEQGGQFLLVSADTLPALTSRAAIALVRGRAYEEVARAPEDTAFHVAVAVQVGSDVVYVVRTRRVNACIRYAKAEPITLDAARGSFRFAFARNPNCGDRSLVPPDGD